MTNTPETDAFGNRPREWPSFARRLERERDQLKAINAEYLETLLTLADANEQAARNSPQCADWSNGVAKGMRVAGDTLTEMLKGAGMCKSNHDEIIPELIRRREAKDRSREIIARLASKAKEEQP
jgi:molecular chaperone GrpE (heat shock protein)